MSWRGLFAPELAAAIVSVLGIVVTLMLLRETKGKSLQELSIDDEADTRAFLGAKA